jgi:lipopolysaccharide export system permease protein
MNLLDRYIVRTVIQATALVTLVVIGLIFLINFLGELRDIGGDYTFLQAFIHVVLELPHNLYQFFPMLVLLGGILGLGVLASHQELMVMRSSGVTLLRFAVTAMVAAILMFLVAVIIGEGIAPRATFMAESMKKSALNGGQAIATTEGVWIHEGNNFLHIDQVIGRHHLEGVTRYEFDSAHRLLAAYYAESLDYEHKQWQLHNVVKTTFTANQAHSQVMAMTTWNLVLNPNLLNVGYIEPNEMSLHSLKEYIQQLEKNGLQASQFQLEFWKRVFQPLTIIVMMLLAVPFVLRAPRAVTMGWRVLYGISLGFIFYIFNAFFGQFSIVFQFSPILAAIFPTLLFAVLGYVFAWRLVK